MLLCIYVNVLANNFIFKQRPNLICSINNKTLIAEKIGRQQVMELRSIDSSGSHRIFLLQKRAIRNIKKLNHMKAVKQHFEN